MCLHPISGTSHFPRPSSPHLQTQETEALRPFRADTFSLCLLHRVLPAPCKAHLSGSLSTANTTPLPLGITPTARGLHGRIGSARIIAPPSSFPQNLPQNLPHPSTWQQQFNPQPPKRSSYQPCCYLQLPAEEFGAVLQLQMLRASEALIQLPASLSTD